MDEVTYKSLFENAADGLVVHDPETGEILDANRRYCELTGYSRDELVGNGLSLVVDDAESALDHLQRARDGETPDVEWRYERRDGTTTRAAVRLSGIDTDGDSRVLAIVRGVANRARGNLSIYLDGIDDVFVVFDQSGDLQYWNQRLRDVTGLTDEEIAGRAPDEFVAPADGDTMETVVQRALSAGQACKELAFQTASDETFPCEFVVTRVSVPGGDDVLVGVGRDTSERTERTRTLRAFDRVLRHNIHNDLTVMMGNAELIQGETDDEAVTADARRIVERGESLLETVEKERNVVNVVSKPVERVVVDLTTAVRRVVTGARESHPEARVEVDAPDAATALAADTLDRALTELVENGLIHNDSEHPEVTVSVTRHEDTVTVRIADNGPGIPEEEVAILTTGRQTEPLYQGTGLGLWLVNWVVSQSSGDVEFAENDPRGSIVTITLERAPGESAPPPSADDTQDR